MILIQETGSYWTYHRFTQWPLAYTNWGGCQSAYASASAVGSCGWPILSTKNYQTKNGYLHTQLSLRNKNLLLPRVPPHTYVRTVSFSGQQLAAALVIKKQTMLACHKELLLAKVFKYVEFMVVDEKR